MNELLKVLLIPFTLIFLCFTSTVFISAIYAQMLDINEEDYFGLDEEGKDHNSENYSFNIFGIFRRTPLFNC